MSSSKQVITIRVNEKLKAAFEKACIKEKRSMSKQGELLIEGWVNRYNIKGYHVDEGDFILDEQNEIPDDIWEGIKRIRDKAS